MLCQNCGKNIEDKSKFCPYCGRPTLNTDSNRQILKPINEIPKVDDSQDDKTSNNRSKRKRMRVIIAAVIILVGLGIVVLGEQFLPKGYVCSICDGSYTVEFRFPLSDEQLERRGYHLIEKTYVSGNETFSVMWTSQDNDVYMLASVSHVDKESIDSLVDRVGKPKNTPFGFVDKNSGFIVYGTNSNSDIMGGHISFIVVDKKNNVTYTIIMNGDSSLVTRRAAKVIKNSIKVTKK